MKLKFLGTGTSQGVPVIGCTCEVCTSENAKDKRLRSSVMITTEENKKILIDCGPDFRQQMLTNHEHTVDIALITHEHNDHVIGLDDMRPLIFKSGKDMPLYCYPRVGNEVKKRFPYAFADEKYPGAPAFELHEIENVLHVNIQDNGKGFDKTAVEKKRNSESGMGLLFMNERIQYINGRVFINSIPGEGTRITFNIPISKLEN